MENVALKIWIYLLLLRSCSEKHKRKWPLKRYLVLKHIWIFKLTSFTWLINSFVIAESFQAGFLYDLLKVILHHLLFSLLYSCLLLEMQTLIIRFLFLQDEHRGQVNSFKWPLEVTPPSSWPCSVLGLFLCEMLLCDLATPQHPPSSSPSLVPSPSGINRKVFIPLENFSFNLSFLCSSVGAKSYPLRESSCRAHACLYGEWFTDVDQEWIDQRQSHDRRSIKHQIKDGNPRAEHKLKICHFFFFFPSCFFSYWHQTHQTR